MGRQDPNTVRGIAVVLDIAAVDALLEEVKDRWRRAGRRAAIHECNGGGEKREKGKTGMRRGVRVWAG